MEISQEVADKLKKALKARKLKEDLTEVISSELLQILSSYDIRPATDTSKRELRKYRVNYYIVSEKGYRENKKESVEALNRTMARQSIEKKYPGCKTTSAWWEK